ncbi:hypothetical protein MOPEL_001_00570 [Mobilicoccus pelagius NBRC 104925]|uniref:Uncharacterized protein n=2 Tax=Mobilicoccus TaxID=984996 RepID=H5UMI1_9MICO|nr:hypothetical protein MOPEL_001_00570 [Mobilicoccus pelagius NBRC 104925]
MSATRGTGGGWPGTPPTPGTSSFGPPLLPPSDAAGPTEAFPRHLFTIDCRPEAMRAAARGYRAVAAEAERWDARIEGAGTASWAGAEGDAYRRARTAYRPMLAAARESFAGLDREVDRCATAVEYAIRRMDVVRSAAETTWARLQEARAEARARPAFPSLVPGLAPMSSEAFDRRVQSTRRTMDLLVEEAAGVRRAVAEAAAQTVADIARLAPPGPVPLPGRDPFGPSVVSRETYEASGTATYQVLVGDRTLRVEQTLLSDGRWRTTVTTVGTLGVEVAPRLAKFEVGGKDIAGGMPDASIGATTSGAVDLVWYSSSRGEADVKAARALALLGTAAITNIPLPPGLLRVEAVGMSAEVEATGSVGYDPSSANPIHTGEEAGGVGASAAAGARVRHEQARDGSREDTLALFARGQAEHPWFDEEGPTQKTYGGSGEVTATMRTGPEGQSILLLSSSRQKAGEDNRYQKRWARVLTPEEARRFRNGVDEIARTKGIGRKGSAAQRTVALIAETRNLTADSPQVRDGTVRMTEATYETETVAEPTISGELGRVGLGAEAKVEREKLVEERTVG